MPGHVKTLSFLLIAASPWWWDCAHPAGEEPEAHKVGVSFSRSHRTWQSQCSHSVCSGSKGHAVASVLTGQSEGTLGIQHNTEADTLSRLSSCPVCGSTFSQEFCSVLETFCGFVYLREILLLFALPTGPALSAVYKLTGRCWH